MTSHGSSRVSGINRGTPELVPLSAIVVRPEFNARQVYRDIPALAASIEESGLEQPLVVYQVEEGDDAIYLQSGFRRHRALTSLAEKLGTPDMEVLCMIKSYASHDEAMFSALAVDTTGDPLRNFDLAVRCDYLQRKYPKRELARLVGLTRERVKQLILLLRDLDPKVIGAWSKSPSPEMEIPLARLLRWVKEPPMIQRRLLDAYQQGDADLVTADGEPERDERGRRLDGKKGRPNLKAELEKIHLRMEDEGSAVERARLEGIVKGLRFAMGQITRTL